MKMSQKTVASDWMSKGLVMVSADDSLRKCYQLMKERNIRHLPVVDVHGQPMGILSDRDLQRAMVRSSESPDWLQAEESYEFEDGDTAKDHMSWPVQWVAEDSQVLEVAESMLKEKVSAYLVKGRSGALRGIITTDDLLRVLVKLLSESGSRSTLKLGELGSQFLGLS